MAYLTVDQIDNAIDALAANPNYTGYLTVENLNHNTAKENKPVKCLKIGKGSIPVVIVDIAWGFVLCSAVATTSFLIANWLE